MGCLTDQLSELQDYDFSLLLMEIVMKKITELVLPIFIVGLFSFSSTTALAQAMPPVDHMTDDRRDIHERSQVDVYKDLKTGEATDKNKTPQVPGDAEPNKRSPAQSSNNPDRIKPGKSGN